MHIFPEIHNHVKYSGLHAAARLTFTLNTIRKRLLVLTERCLHARMQIVLCTCISQRLTHECNYRQDCSTLLPQMDGAPASKDGVVHRLAAQFKFSPSTSLSIGWYIIRLYISLPCILLPTLAACCSYQ